MPKLLEYQGKELFKRYGIPVPKGSLVMDRHGLRKIGNDVGYPLVIKAQIHSGGRAKAGGIQIANNWAELNSISTQMFKTQIKSYPVRQILIEKFVEYDRELFIGISADPSPRSPIIMIGMHGGIDIEETSLINPDSISAHRVNILRGLHQYDILNLLRTNEILSSPQKIKLAQLACTLYSIYRNYNCVSLEINPLVLLENKFMALDARIEVDSDAIQSQEELGLEIAEDAGDREPTVLEMRARAIDLRDHRGTVHFVQMDTPPNSPANGELIPIGFDCVGAGTSLTLMDELIPYGFFPINFCDTSGNPVASKLYRITKIIFSQPDIQGYVFASCISSQQLDNTARGIIKALLEIFPESQGQPNIPTVLAFRGAWDEEAIKLMNVHGISDGRWVKVLGRETTESEIASVLKRLHSEWDEVRIK